MYLSEASLFFCSYRMYVVLRGRLSVFQTSDVIIPEVKDKEERPVQVVINSRKPVRLQLGQFVTNLGTWINSVLLLP